MKDEIKELIDLLEYDVKKEFYFEITPEHSKILLDYITNLQKENKNLKQINEEHRKINGELRKTINEAIEWIKSNLDNTGWLEIGSQDVEVLINLLQGSDE